MTDPRAQSPEALAALAQRIAYARSIVWLEEAKPIDGLQAAGDRVLLSDHAAYLADRVAEAERDAKEERAKWRESVLNVGNERDDLFDKLARERADHAATVTALREAQTLSDNRQEWIDGYLKKQGYESDLATEKAARLAAEGQEAELRDLLRRFEWRERQVNGVVVGFHCPSCGVEQGMDHADAEVSYQEVKAADCALADAVRTWRARRSGGEGG